MDRLLTCAALLGSTVAARLRLGAGFGVGRPIASVLLLALLPVARVVPAIAAIGLVAAVCVALIVYEVVRHREARAWIRSRRGAFTTQEVSGEADRRRTNRGRADGLDGLGGEAADPR